MHWLVMDSHLKLQYYEDNKWEHYYINVTKRTITELWETTYRNTTPNLSDFEKESNDLLSHVYKKRRIERNDELTKYLREPVAARKTDILLWWKVIFYNHL